MKKHFLLTFILFILLGYQNCSPVNFLSINSSVLDLKSDNNGTGYGGKPDYYRFVPDFTCEAKVSPVSSLHITDTQATLVENKKLACGAVTTNLDPHLIDTSVYQSEIVGYQEGIYEGESTAPEAIPANLVEVWCRDQKDESGIETITHFNRTTQEAVTRIYYSKPVTNKNQTINQHQEISDFSVARILSFNRVTIQDKQNFDLKVFRDQPAADLGLFKGEMNAVIEGQKVHRETSCRLGGSVDAKLWPVAQIVDLSVWQFTPAPDLSSFAFSSSTLSPSIYNLFSSDFAGNQIKKIGPQFQMRGVEAFNYSSDSKSLFYWADPAIDNAVELLKTDLSTGNSVRLNDKNLVNTGGNYNLAIPSGDGKTIFFEEKGTDQYSSWILKSVPLAGGATATISPTFAPSPQYSGTFDFGISNSAHRVAFLAGTLFSTELYIADFDGQNLIKPKIVLPDSQFSFLINTGIERPDYGGYATLVVPDPGNVVVLRAWKERPELKAYDRYDYLVSIDGSQVSRLPLDWYWTSGDPTGQKHLIRDNYWNFNLYDLATGALYDLPQISDPFFTQNLLVGTRKLANGQLEAVNISTRDGQIASLCNGGAGSSIKILSVANDRLLIASYDSQNQILNVFEKREGKACQHRSAMPIAGANVVAMSLSPDEQKLLIQFSVTAWNSQELQLVYVPLNGAPPILINTPTYSGALIGAAYFSKDSSSIIYSGNQINPKDYGIFLWHTPKEEVQP